MNRNRNRNFSKVGTGTGTRTITFQKLEPEPRNQNFSKVGTGNQNFSQVGTGTVKNSYTVPQQRCAQVLLTAGEVRRATEILASRLPADWRVRPGVLSALVTLHLALEDRPAAAAALKAATEWNLKNKVRGVGTVRMFLGLPDPDPLVRGTDPAPDPSLSHKSKKLNFLD